MAQQRVEASEAGLVAAKGAEDLGARRLDRTETWELPNIRGPKKTPNSSAVSIGTPAKRTPICGPEELPIRFSGLLEV